MVATRSKTRSSTGGGDDQPKIDDVLEDTGTGKKRRASKGGKEAAAKGGAKNKKRKTEEGAEQGEEAKPGEEVGDAQGDVNVNDAAGNGEASGTSGQLNGNETASGANKDDQGKIDDSSRVDAPAKPKAAETNASSEDTRRLEDTKEEEDKDQADQAESQPKNETSESDVAGATDKKEVKEAEKEIVQNDNVTEYGTIHFLYKPKVEVLHPGSVDDVQRLHIILQPHSQGDPSGKPVLSRMIHVGRKVLPAAGHGRRQPFWAFVSAVAEDVGELHDALKESKNDTKTRGVRTTGADRLIASGPYCIISQPASSNSDRRTSFLCYATTLPREPGEVQKAFNIDAEGSFTISVKNPAGGDPPRAGLKEKAEFPDELQSKIGTLRWHAIDPPTFLDYPNAELLLIASHGADIAHHAGQEIAHELEQIADEGDVADVEEDEKHEIEAGVQKGIFGMLKARGKEHVVEGQESLIEGNWV